MISQSNSMKIPKVFKSKNKISNFEYQCNLQSNVQSIPGLIRKYFIFVSNKPLMSIKKKIAGVIKKKTH